MPELEDKTSNRWNTVRVFISSTFRYMHTERDYLRKWVFPILGKKLPNDLRVILETLEPFQKEIQGIVVESTYNWYLLVYGLQEANYKVYPKGSPFAKHKR